MINKRIKNNTVVSRRAQINNYRVITGILLGFLLFGLKGFVVLVYQPLQSLVALLGLFLIFATPFLFNYKIQNPLNSKIKVIYFIFLAYIAHIVLRPFFTNQSYSNNTLHPYMMYGLTSYLLPLIVLLGIEIISIKKLFQIVVIFAIIGFIYFFVNYSTMKYVIDSGILWGIDGEVGINQLADEYYFWFAISSFTLLCFEFLPKNYKWFTIISNVFMMFLLLFFARRGGVLMYLLYFIGAFYLYINRYKGKKGFLKILIVLFVIAIAASIILINSDSVFSLFFERINDDSRSDVDNTILKYLTSTNAWIFGNGIEAAYKHPFFDLPRYTHETGYLYLIMKGGIVYLGLYVFLLLHAFYKGFFKTKNRLTKGISIYVLFHVVFLIPFGLPSFGLEYLFVWIGFAICESEKWRKKSDQYIKLNF